MVNHPKRFGPRDIDPGALPTIACEAFGAESGKSLPTPRALEPKQLTPAIRDSQSA